MRRWTAVAFGLGLMSVVAWLGACSEQGVTDPPVSEGAIVSDPERDASATSAGAHRGATLSFPAAAGAAESDVAYIALPPRTAPDGVLAILRNPRVGGTVWVAMRDGGFDPVPFVASAGDLVEVEIQRAGGAPGPHLSLVVPARRPPRVVRTVPPRGRKDVPVNSSIVVVFSEPVDEATLSSSSVQLLRGSAAIAGRVRLLQGSGAAVAFTPNAPLGRRVDYRLVVTRAVTDRKGDALEAGTTVSFTTGTSTTGPPASIIVSPDTVFMVGPTYQMTAVVQDAAGNILVDQPLTWSTDEPSGLAVSATGLVTAQAAGAFHVNATVNELTASAMVFVNPGPATSVAVSPTPAAVATGDTIILTATARDASGYLVPDPSVAWTSSAPAVATVAPYGSVVAGRAFATVTGMGPGSVAITATSGVASGTASVTVAQPGPPASVTVAPASTALLLGVTTQLTATVRDANGVAIRNRPISWTSGNAGVATVDATGVVTGIGPGSAAVMATSEGVTGTALITVTVIDLQTVQSGGSHACGLTTSGAAHCWGSNGYGQLGDGSRVDSPWPVAVAGALTFSSLSVGLAHNCGLTTSGAGYCWGSNDFGELGDGSRNSSPIPVAVAAGLSIVSLSAGDSRTCGLIAAGAAYCWGANYAGQLGAASTETCAGSPCSTRPLAVRGGHTFSMVSVSGAHSCGLATSGVAYCWGRNDWGALGDGSTTSRSVPERVRGDLTFSTISGGGFHSCAIATSGAAYCWGWNYAGQLGNGSTTASSVPVAVSGGLAFASVSVGESHSCGVTTSGVAYCWGNGTHGQLGAGYGGEQCGTHNCSTRPAAVTGGLTFARLSAGGARTCGMTVGGTAYCWGTWGLGSSWSHSVVPVKVAGQP